jgi:WD40 repeat protein
VSISPKHDFYVTAGTMAGTAPSYVARAADDALVDALSEAEYCYVLSPRQMGKSSLMIRAMRRLQAADIAVAVIDLNKLGYEVTADQWYNSLLIHLGDRLGLLADVKAFVAAQAQLSPLQRWMSGIRELLLARIPGRIVIFIDEIDMVRRLPFSTDEFFAAIRACYNARAEEDTYQRLTFCLLGTATPADLIADVRLTPFNIGRRIRLEDFTGAEAARLQSGMACDPETGRRLMARIFYWTDGHPCLTQRLCKAVVESAPIGGEADVDAVCARLFLMYRGDINEDNLAFVSQRLLGGDETEATEQILLYERVLSGKPIQDDETRPVVAQLKLSGVVKAERERLVVRNRIYAHVFNRAWVRKHLPGAEQRRQRAAFRRGVFRTATVAAVMLAIVTSLAITAVRQANRADRYAQQARAEAARSLQLLYASDMSQMQLAYDQNDFRRLRSLLAETQSNPDRGFEWYYWESKLHADALTLRGHTGEVRTVTFSPNGRRVLTCGDDGLIKVWDVVTGRECVVIKQPFHAEWAVFSPDGRKILSQQSIPNVALWDAANGQLLARQQDYGMRLDFLQKNTNLAAYIHSGGKSPLTNRPFRLYRFCNQLLICWYNTISIKSRSDWVFAPDGRDVACVTNANNVLLLGSGRRRSTILPTHRTSTVYKLLFSPDSSRLIICYRDGAVTIWDVAAGRLLRRLLGHRGQVRMAAFSPDGRKLVTVGDDRIGIVWDVITGRELAVLRGHEAGINWVCYSPDGRWIATAGRDGMAKIWNVKTTLELAEQAAHGNNSSSGLRSNTGRFRISIAMNGQTTLWNSDGNHLALGRQYPPQNVTELRFSSDDRRLLIASNNGDLHIWNTEDGKLLLKLKASANNIRSAAFAPDGNRLVTASDNRNRSAWEVSGWKWDVSVWDLLTGRAQRLMAGHDEIVFAVDFSPNGRLIATAGTDKMVRLWEASTGKLIRTLAGHTERIYTVAFSSDGRRLVSGSRDRTARLWDVKTGKPLLVIEGEDPVYSATFSPDGHRILTGGGQTTRLWDAAGGRQMLALSDHGKEVSSVAFSQDGGKIITTNADDTQTVWSSNAASR